MLHSLNANKEDFKEVLFEPGINLILAERAPGASEQHSRNARGKTSLIQAINFCLGGARPAAFRSLAEDGWEFSLVIDLFGSKLRVTRSLQGGSRLAIESPESSVPQIVLGYMREDETISLQDWKFLLGLGLFSLDEESSSREHGLSPRTLLSYTTRLDAPRDPTKILSQQPAWSSRQHMAFLLGLDWRYTHRLVRMEKEEQTFEAIQYAADERLMPEIITDESQLVLERSEAEREAQRLNGQLESFTLLEDPEGVVAESNELAADLNELSDAQVIDRRLLSLYEESIDDSEEPVQEGSVNQLFEELGLTFSREALLRFDQVAEFHQTIISNRRRFLAAEIARIRAALSDREARIGTLNDRRSSLLRQLSSGGGVADLLELQRRASEAKARLGAIDGRIRAVRSVQASKDALSVRQATTRRDARSDLDRDRAFLDAVNVRFDSMIRRLYDRSGSVNVEVDHLGYKFSVKVSGSSSSGITRMQLLCFDLTLMIQSPANRHPHFLIHDSIVFDGVDPRQISAGLTLASEIADEIGGQYIATMNSNDVPEQIKASSWYQKCVRRVVLDTEIGGAFGREF